MASEILTYPLEPGQVRAELEHVVNYFVNLGFDSCSVLFGYAWGNHYYSTQRWEEHDLELEALLPEVDRAEAMGYGSLGRDDLFIRVRGLPLELRFCNDSDIHIYLEQSHEVAEALYQRWKELGYNPAEWTRPTDGCPSDRIRSN